MEKISEDKKKELYELVEKQKKANISWVGTITQLSENQIITIAPDLDLIVDKDQIMLPTETKEAKSTLLEASTHKETSTHTAVVRTSKGRFIETVKRFFKKPALIAFIVSLTINIIFVITFAILISTNSGWAFVIFAYIAFPIGLVILIFVPLLTYIITIYFRK